MLENIYSTPEYAIDIDTQPTLIVRKYAKNTEPIFYRLCVHTQSWTLASRMEVWADLPLI